MTSISPTSYAVEVAAQSSNTEVASAGNRERRRRSVTRLHMCVNSDAKVSHDMWVCCAVLSLAQVHRASSVPFPYSFDSPSDGRMPSGGNDNIVAALMRLADRQVYWEAQSELSGMEE